jgi:hypothetical protein
MSQVARYRQYWMATLKDRHDCNICGELAVNAEYLETDNGVIQSVDWVCDAHINANNSLAHTIQGECRNSL